MLMTEELSRISDSPRMLPVDWPRRTVKLLGVFLMAAVPELYSLRQRNRLDHGIYDKPLVQVEPIK